MSDLIYLVHPYSNGGCLSCKNLCWDEHLCNLWFEHVSFCNDSPILHTYVLNVKIQFIDCLFQPHFLEKKSKNDLIRNCWGKWGVKYHVSWHGLLQVTHIFLIMVTFVYQEVKSDSQGDPFESNILMRYKYSVSQLGYTYTHVLL